jgi:Family of unknown function (DUF6152)
MRQNTIVITAAISIASAIPAFAHHGWGGNVDEVTAMTGTVTEGVKLAGPHGTMKIKDADGKVWDITLAPPARTSSAGLKQDTIPVGAMVTVHGQRNRNPNRYEMKTIQVEYAGKQYTVYPEFARKVR